MREGGGGNDGVGQLHAVLLAQADGALDGGLIEREHFHALHEGLEKSKLGGRHQFPQQLNSGDNRNAPLLRGPLGIEPSGAGHREPAKHQVNHDVGIG